VGHFSLSELVHASFNAADLVVVGHTVSELKSFGFGPRELRHAPGVDVSELIEKFSLAALKKGDAFTCTELHKLCGFDLQQLFEVGYGAAPLRRAGFSFTAIIQAGCSLKDIRSAVFDDDELDEWWAALNISLADLEGHTTSRVVDCASIGSGRWLIPSREASKDPCSHKSCIAAWQSWPWCFSAPMRPLDS